MIEGPTVFAVFESKKAWEQRNPNLAKCGYGRFLEDDESLSLIVEEIRQGGMEINAWSYEPGDFPSLLAELRSLPNSILWNLTDGYEFFAGANLPAFVQLAGVPHIGSGSYTQMLCQNKHHLKAVAQSIGILVTEGVSFNQETKRPLIIPRNIHPPYFVKPTRLDNSIGDQVVAPVCEDDVGALTAVHRLFDLGIADVLVEEYVGGDEFSIIAVDKGFWIFECAHITYDNVKYFSSRIKDNDAYRCDFVDGIEAREMIAACERLAAAIKLRDYFRADFRCDSAGRPKLLEVNSGPFLATLTFDKLARLHFGGRPAMFKAIIAQSLQRQRNTITENHWGAR